MGLLLPLPRPDQAPGKQILVVGADFSPPFFFASHESPVTSHEIMNKLTINDLDLRGKRVFIRVDFNVPLKDGVVTDDTRIRESLPTLRLAIQKGGRLVLASHLGRPKGGPDSKYSLAPVAKKLQQLIGRAHRFSSDCVRAATESERKS